MNVHAGAQQAVNAIAAKLQSFPGKKRLIQLLVEATGKAGPVWQGKGVRSAVHADPARTVRAAGNWNAIGLKSSGYTAKGTGDAGGNFGRTHALSANDGTQVLVTKLGEELLHGNTPFCRIPQRPALVPGIRKAGGECGEPLLPAVQRTQRNRFCVRDQESFGRETRFQPSESLHRRHSLFTLLHQKCFRKLKTSCFAGVANMITNMNAVLSGLKHPGGTISGDPAVIIGCQEGERQTETQRFRFTGSQQTGFPKREKSPYRFAKGSLRGAAIDLNYFLAGTQSGVSDRYIYPDTFRKLYRKGGCLHGKCRIRQTEAKGIENLFRGKGLKIPVTDIDVLSLNVFCSGTEIGSRGPVGNIAGNGVCQMAGGSHITGQSIQDGVAAFLPALPHVQNRSRGKFTDPAHIDDVAGVEEDNRLRKVLTNPMQHIALGIRQKKAARCISIVLVLAGRPSDDYQRDIRLLRAGLNQLIRKRHLLLKPGFGCPALSGVKRMILQPVFISRSECGVDRIAV